MFDFFRSWRSRPIAVDEQPSLASAKVDETIGVEDTTEKEPVLGPPVVDDAVSALFAALGAGNFKKRLVKDEHPLADVANPALTAVDAAVSEVLALADLLASGDLTTEASGSYQGDLASMRDALNTIRQGLTELIGNAHATSDNVLSKSHELTDLTANLTEQSERQKEIAGAVSEQISALQEVGEKLSSAVGQSAETTAVASATSQKGYERSVEAVEAIEQMRKGSEEITAMLSLIEDIAQQTNLLAINASIEAARAGDAGAGFLVVSAEVKALADRSSEATERIRKTNKTIEAAVSQCSSAMEDCGSYLDEVTKGLKQLDIIADSVSDAASAQSQAVGQAEKESTGLRDTARASASATQQVQSMALELSEIVESLGQSLDNFKLTDTEMRRHVKLRADKICSILEDSIARGVISESDLFDRDYILVEGSDPQQFTTSAAAFLDASAQDVVESAFEIGPGVVFSALMNSDGFLFLNSLEFSQPQRSNDPVWNSANSRNRRFFDDRVGMAVATSTEPVLLQAYRRDMGGGKFVTMKDISAPISVNGRHWGGFRIGYQTAKDAKHAEPALTQRRSA